LDESNDGLSLSGFRSGSFEVLSPRGFLSGRVDALSLSGFRSGSFEVLSPRGFLSGRVDVLSLSGFRSGSFEVLSPRGFLSGRVDARSLSGFRSGSFEVPSPRGFLSGRVDVLSLSGFLSREVSGLFESDDGLLLGILDREVRAPGAAESLAAELRDKTELFCPRSVFDPSVPIASPLVREELDFNESAPMFRPPLLQNVCRCPYAQMKFGDLIARHFIAVFILKRSF
jgi:hypothetical protein